MKKFSLLLTSLVLLAASARAEVRSIEISIFGMD
jgi:hypothetical protein